MKNKKVQVISLECNFKLKPVVNRQEIYHQPLNGQCFIFYAVYLKPFNEIYSNVQQNYNIFQRN